VTFPSLVLCDLPHVQISQVFSLCYVIPTSLLLSQDSGLVCFLLVLLSAIVPPKKIIKAKLVHCHSSLKLSNGFPHTQTKNLNHYNSLQGLIKPGTTLFLPCSSLSILCFPTARHALASGPLYLLWLLPWTVFLQIFKSLTFFTYVNVTFFSEAPELSSSTSPSLSQHSLFSFIVL
jgi:hypothetical protein